MNQNLFDNSAQRNLPTKFCPALTLLFEASVYSEQTYSNPWEFAVGIKQLRKLGLSKTDLRFLVRMQIVEHASEVTILGQDGRKFQPTGDLTFTKRTCFILTSHGQAAARRYCEAQLDNGTPGRSAVRATVNPYTASDRPTWDRERRLLRIGGTIVKHFKCNAVNQEAILSAFEEEGWPARIDDPLPPQPEQHTKRRLSDTVKCLNRKQNNRLVHFRNKTTPASVKLNQAK